MQIKQLNYKYYNNNGKYTLADADRDTDKNGFSSNLCLSLCLYDIYLQIYFIKMENSVGTQSSIALENLLVKTVSYD